MWNLGRDIIFGEILPKLPPKSLIRLKCVSKSLYSVISSREFIQLYLCYHSRSSDDDDDLFIIHKDGSVLCYRLDSSAPVATFTWHDQGSMFIIGSCNGVLCTDPPIAFTYCLLNPTTRVYCDVMRRVNPKRGFAFDPVNHDFKVVGFTDKRNNEGIDTRITMVYSLNANSCTTLDSEFPTDSVEGWHRHGVVINYCLVHWMFWSPALRKRRIGCFDVCKIKWTDDVLLPRYYYDPTRRNYLLDFGVFDGSLCSSFENKVDSCFDVWVMMEYGVQDSWFKLFSIPISNNYKKG